jgi:SAM-dependent methyltransferase
VSSDDWNRHWRDFADSAASNPAQAYRRFLIFRARDLENVPKPVRLLELGSGQGDLARELIERHPEIELVGTDASDEGLEIARSKVPNALFFHQDLLEPLELPERYLAWATHAVCSEVLEHLDEPITALRNARACLAPGARLVVTVPAGPMSAFDRHIGHRRHYTPALLRRVLEEAGLEVQSLHGAGFPFFNLYRLTVVARGKKLIDDAGGDRPLPATARVAMRAFSKLFALNAEVGLRGWQLVAVAQKPLRAS